MIQAAQKNETIEVLISLWHGDEDSTGYWHANLAAAIASAMQPHPQSWFDLAKRIYPSWPDWVHADATQIILDGYRHWVVRREHRAA